MTQSSNSNSLTSRRDFIKTTGTLAAVSALAGVALPKVHAAGNEEIRVVLIGCGGRGTGAAGNALSVANRGPIKLVAMADAFQDRLNSSFDTLHKQFADKMDVPEDRSSSGSTVTNMRSIVCAPVTSRS